MNKKRAGFIAVLGPTNAGKSTLINKLVGSHVSIVSSKVQTTRTTVKGIFNYKDTQMVLIDTPGIFKARSRLERSMISTAFTALSDANAVLIVIDPKSAYKKEVTNILKRIDNFTGPVFLAINKVDSIEKVKLLEIAKTLYDLYKFEDVFFISATKDIALDVIKENLSQFMPENPWFYSEDEVSDFPLKLFACEMVREQVYKNLNQELPYSITVEPDKVEETEYGYDFYLSIITLRDNQKKIIIGKGGSMLKKIGQQARFGLQKELGIKAKLFLFVKVKEDIFEKDEFYINWKMK